MQERAVDGGDRGSGEQGGVELGAEGGGECPCGGEGDAWGGGHGLGSWGVVVRLWNCVAGGGGSDIMVGFVVGVIRGGCDSCRLWFFGVCVRALRGVGCFWVLLMGGSAGVWEEGGLGRARMEGGGYGSLGGSVFRGSHCSCGELRAY